MPMDDSDYLEPVPSRPKWEIISAVPGAVDSVTLSIA